MSEINADTLRADPLLGKLLDGRYRILKSLGLGGMGFVYLGEQISTARKVAIKILRSFRGDDENEAWTERDNQLLRFFQQEARALARLNHPNVAQVYDASTEGQILYIAMEYVEGITLKTYLNRNGKLNVKDATYVLKGAGEALDAAHKANIIHRDIKPDNIMIVPVSDNSFEVKLLDFGIAILDQLSALQNETGVSEFAGTPSYMSPEQVNGEQLTPASDIYSLGVVGYEILTGTNPFVSGRSPYQTAANQITLTPPPMSDFVSTVPTRTEAVIMKALEKNPLNRFSTAKEFADAL